MKLEEGNYIIENENQTMVHNDIRNVLFFIDSKVSSMNILQKESWMCSKQIKHCIITAKRNF